MIKDQENLSNLVNNSLIRTPLHSQTRCTTMYYEITYTYSSYRTSALQSVVWLPHGADDILANSHLFLTCTSYLYSKCNIEVSTATTCTLRYGRRCYSIVYIFVHSCQAIIIHEQGHQCINGIATINMISLAILPGTLFHIKLLY